MLILCFLNLFSVLIFFFPPPVHYYTPSIASAAIAFFFFFSFFYCSLTSVLFIFQFHNFPFHFSFSSCLSFLLERCLSLLLIFSLSALHTHTENNKRKKYSHLQKSSFEIHIMMSAGERSGVSFQQNHDPADKVFIYFLKLFCFPSFLRRGISADLIHHRARRRGKANISSAALSCARVRQLLSD